MECVAAKAFKTKFWPETSVKSNQPVVFEDFWGGNGPNGGVSENEFLVDEFLDFSKEETFVQSEEDEEEREEKDCVSVSSQEQNSSSSGFSAKDDFLLVSASDFSVPTDDMANLEWLSHFVEDSFSEFALSYPAAGSPEKTQVPGSDRCEPEPETRPSSMLKPATFPAQVPGRARTKRSRTGGRVWSVGTPSFTETSSSSTTTTTGGGAASTTSSASSSPSSTSCLIFTNTAPNLEFLDLDYLGKPPAKKKKNKSKNPASKNNGVAPPQRRCSHCGVQKTPQWRAGPLGAKTLCNACGVRFKSGRLLPEYRPACSPTFSSEVHSNSHRKVLEMRRKKETAQPDSELAPAVQSF